MHITLPVNYNYRNDKIGWTDLEIKQFLKSNDSSFNKQMIKDCFDNFDEVYLSDSRFSNLNVISLRKSTNLDKDQDAFVIKFYKKKIGGETIYYIETGQYAGYINYKGFVINISLSERYNVSVLNHLLTYANNISLDSEAILTSYKTRTNELEYLLCFMFLQKLEKASILGLPKRFQNVNERLNTVRGKVEFNSFIKRDIPFQGKVSVHYRDRSDIQEIIDVLFYTLYIIKNKYSSNSLFKVRNVYNELLSKYSKIKPKSDTIFKAKSHPILANPLFVQFKKVLELAEVIIKSFSPDFNQESKKQISGNLYNTSELFELYIEKILKSSLKGWSLDAQKEISIYKNHFFSRKMIPDFILHNVNQDKYAILDAKFKTMNYNYLDVDREDIFQLHTYSYYYHDKNVLSGLVYPLQKEVDVSGKHISNTLDQYSNRFGIFGVELNKNSNVKSIKESESKFINQINELLNQESEKR
ncbi:hypothetical protein A1704_12435 [Chryseobacterium cucumeris]|uniref:5-methylcytosine restriction system specificity protein McrC n=1 Tax=Chryseobacterium cucumeris TaxID=1813611 RepID=UPI0007881DEA|nr:hypothetical protein [Chryseobacterium cucumeris]KYH05894.1 hypothetical protein A1704_12435 [Chryseobacterium cucumeris]